MQLTARVSQSARGRHSQADETGRRQLVLYQIMHVFAGSNLIGATCVQAQCEHCTPYENPSAALPDTVVDDDRLRGVYALTTPSLHFQHHFYRSLHLL